MVLFWFFGFLMCYGWFMVLKKVRDYFFLEDVKFWLVGYVVWNLEFVVIFWVIVDEGGDVFYIGVIVWDIVSMVQSVF